MPSTGLLITIPFMFQRRVAEFCFRQCSSVSVTSDIVEVGIVRKTTPRSMLRCWLVGGRCRMVCGDRSRSV